MKRNTEVGGQIKLYREKIGLTQKNLAAYLSVDQSLIAKVEKGERCLSSDMLDKIADLFGVSVNAFHWSGVQEKPIAFALRARDLDSSDMVVIAAINRIALNNKFMTELLKK